MAFQWLSISMILIVLSLAQIDASKYRSIRQTRVDECPEKACIFVNCENGECVEDPTTADCFKCRCRFGFTGKLCELAILPDGCAPGCQNGQCSGNICICSSGFTGSFCEKQDYCSTNNFCQNNGTCTTTGTGYVCKCAIGWTGDNCETRDSITSCTPNPCGAHGDCIQTILQTGPTVFCNCADRWTGKYCDVNIDVGSNSTTTTTTTIPTPGGCSSNPCLNGGTCFNNANSFVCACPSPWAGLRCDYQISTTTTTTTIPISVGCSSNPCLNGGSCFNNANTFFCACPSPWAGLRCDYQISTTTTTTTIPTLGGCSSNPCLNGGTCFNNANSFFCACRSPWTGSRCDSYQSSTTTTTTTFTPQVGTCSSNPCLNGGSCFNTGNGYICVCQPQWAGSQCDYFQGSTTTPTPSVTNNTSCSPNPCYNGGSCFRNGNGYVCVCTSLYTGATCALAKTTTTPSITTTNSGVTCTNRPCQNGGLCYNAGNGYFCFCGTNSNFTGTNCETNIAAPPPSSDCPLDCAPGRCVPTGNAQQPHACLCNGMLNPTKCTSN